MFQILSYNYIRIYYSSLIVLWYFPHNIISYKYLEVVASSKYFVHWLRSLHLFLLGMSNLFLNWPLVLQQLGTRTRCRTGKICQVHRAWGEGCRLVCLRTGWLRTTSSPTTPWAGLIPSGETSPLLSLITWLNDLLENKIPSLKLIDI